MEIRVDVSGISCHCSTPERGDNAIYKIEDIFQDVTSLNKNVSNTEIKGLVKMLEPKFNKEAETTNFLGKGIVTVSQIGYTRPRFVQLEMDVGYHLIEEFPQEKNLNHIFKNKSLPVFKKYTKDIVIYIYKYQSPSTLDLYTLLNAISQMMTYRK